MAEAKNISTALKQTAEVDKTAQNKNKKHVYQRGPFKLFANPKMNQPFTHEMLQEFIKVYDFTELIDRYGEEAVQKKVAELLEAYADGFSMTELFVQDRDDGMSLVHVWFAPNMPFIRHSHLRYGDCIYYVLAGELILGKRRLGPGSGFFLPCGQPYKLTAGPEGVEILEFRADGLGDPEVPDTTVEERSLDDIQRLIDVAKANKHLWKPPASFGDTGHVKT